MGISDMSKTEDQYHLLVLAWEHLSGWAESPSLKQSTLEKEGNVLYEELSCRFQTPDGVVVDVGAANRKWTDLLLKCFTFRKFTINLYPATAN